MVNDDEDHSHGAEEDGESVEAVVGNHGGRCVRIREGGGSVTTQVRGSGCERLLNRLLVEFKLSIGSRIRYPAQ